MKNQNGIEIKACCASCRHKDLTRLMTARYCLLHHKSVHHCESCNEWAMSVAMKAAGSAAGKVKRKAYLMYVLEVREDESLADQLGLSQFPHKTLDEIRKDFEQKNGSIYEEL